jgi:signal transduction histidine kinase
LEEAADLPSGDFQLFLGGIKKGADRLTQLVEDLLMVVKLDTGELQREFDLLGSVQDDLAGMIRRVALVEARKAADQGVKMEVEVPDSLPPVLVHEYFLDDALARLVDNAVKFTHTEEKRIRISGEIQDGCVAIAVQDWGVGIPAAQVDRLFEVFGQIDRRKMEQQGTGLGLVIAQALVTCMGGDIDLVSSQQEPSGTTVTMRLPLAESSQS